MSAYHIAKIGIAALHARKDLVLVIRPKAVFQAVCTCGITVDKEKLLEALKCSHNYYTQGYDDGFRDGAEKAIKEFAERVIEYIYESDDINHITDWGICEIAKEMGVEM